ncbi:MAG TPA: peptide-N4-asparagine amidase, partial [Acidobacteriaceae bacterium]|nr:peptide-N4-asparagine amidase [Acidobacteriaceae bacterium]
MPRRTLCLISALLLPLSFAASAQVVPAPAVPQVGSSNPVSPEPNVPRPSTTPCSVTLFSNLAFADYSNKPLTFTPPAGCPGPWSRVVLTADFTVSAGRQYDRTGTIFLGGANIYFGTTAEPRAALSPSWHVERDLTDYSALFTQPQTGDAFLGNIVNSTYTGIVYGT